MLCLYAVMKLKISELKAAFNLLKGRPESLKQIVNNASG